MFTSKKQKFYSQSQLRKLLNIRDIIPAVRDAFLSYARGNAQMPSKNYLEFNRFNGDVRSMEAEIPSMELATVKIVNAHPDNPEKFNLPNVMALLIALNPENGLPIAVMDGTEITALRTAAASALATKLFSPADSSNLGVIGTGAQAPHQIKGQLQVRNIDQIMLFDKEKKSVNQLSKHLEVSNANINLLQADSISDLIQKSDIIISLTPSKEPIVSSLKSIPFKNQIHINAMGADAQGKREWPDDIFEFSVIVDDWKQAKHSGEIQYGVDNGSLTEHDIRELGTALLKQPNLSNEPTIFDSTGLAIQDTAGAYVVLNENLQPDMNFNFFG